MDPGERPSKHQAFLAFLAEGWVSLHLDARRDGVDVPQPFGGQPHLVLQYGHDMPIPIPDMDVTEAGVGATLSFSQMPHKTHVPWDAVYIVECNDGRGVIYKEDVPAEVALWAPPDSKGHGNLAAVAPDSTLTDSAPGGGQVRVLQSVPDSGDGKDGVPAARRRKRPTLRVVK